MTRRSGFFFIQFLSHVEGEKARNIGKISSLPRSIATDRSTFDGALNTLNDDIGPTAPSPGPILLKQAEVAENAVSKSNGSSEISRKITANVRQ